MSRFASNQRMIGLALAVGGVCSIVYSAALEGPIVARLGERRTLLTGLLFAAAGFVIYGLTGSAITFFCGDRDQPVVAAGPTNIAVAHDS